MRPNAKIETARAFTVIELTLVVAIILILSGLLLPALCQANDAERAESRDRDFIACRDSLADGRPERPEQRADVFFRDACCLRQFLR